MVDICERFKEIRESVAMSQANFARSIQASPSLVSDIERGEKEPSKKLILSLIKAFQVNSNWLLTGDGEMFFDKEKEETSLEVYRIPVLRQRASAGPGQEWNSDVNIEKYVRPLDLFPGIAAVHPYAFTVSGTSMAGVGIVDGDIVLFDSREGQETHDDIYVFAVDGDVYVKFLVFDAMDRTITAYSMMPDGTKKQVLSLAVEDPEQAERFHLFGRVVAWVHQNRLIRR
jgi:SOS-response transcriptional repressor LexA